MLARKSTRRFGYRRMPAPDVDEDGEPRWHPVRRRSHESVWRRRVPDPGARCSIGWPAASRSPGFCHPPGRPPAVASRASRAISGGSAAPVAARAASAPAAAEARWPAAVPASTPKPTAATAGGAADLPGRRALPGWLLRQRHRAARQRQRRVRCPARRRRRCGGHDLRRRHSEQPHPVVRCRRRVPCQVGEPGRAGTLLLPNRGGGFTDDRRAPLRLRRRQKQPTDRAVHRRG